ncbi:hypothetical protein OAQ99_07265 [Candidatus Kapabacteria bacterium]|nr:hypothetical protein [Candidatus Kapabacteria bacterium]
MSTQSQKNQIIDNPSKNGSEISITGKWIPKKKGILFLKSEDSKELISEWNDIHNEAKAHPGVLSTEINHAIGKDAILVHHVFRDKDSLINYFNTIAPRHIEKLKDIATPDTQLVRGIEFNDDIIKTISDKANVNFGEYIYGYVRNDYEMPDEKDAIQVTAKWKVKKDSNGTLEDLINNWRKVAIEANDIEKGLLRFEAYKVIGEEALIIHETFKTNDDLQFHLTKGTAAKYKKDIDTGAFPENYFFRGPVSWMIRTYSKFMNLPATYTTLGKSYKADDGSFSDGIIK